MQGKYDVILETDDDTFGYMLDRAVSGPDVDLAESEPQQQNTSESASAAGVYNWKDQRTMPGVAISDFRSGQGQRVLDRQDATANAFRDGRHIECGVEGEISLAPSFVGVACHDIEDKIIEAAGTIFASFHPAAMSEAEPAPQPKSVRYLYRYTVSLANDVAAMPADPANLQILVDVDDDSEIEVGDWLYDFESREVFAVTVLATGVPDQIKVTRGAGMFDSIDDSAVAVAHTSGALLYGYGWRAVEFDPVAAHPNEKFPQYSNDYTHVRSMTFDGEYLYVAFSDSNADGEVWRAPVGVDLEGELLVPDVGKLTLYLKPLFDVQQIVYGLGVLYYATSNIAGFIGNNVAGDLEAQALSMTKVVGDKWSVDHFVDDARFIEQPSVDSVFLTMSNTFCYWVTSAGRNSWLYRPQAPAGFELVYPFAKGYRATCMESAYGEVFVGGYFTQKDGNGPGKDSYEGAVYMFKDDIAKRVVSLETQDFGLDNRIKGITVVGQVLMITTNTDIYRYSVKSGGWWHSGKLPPKEFTPNKIVPVPGADYDYAFDFDGLPTSGVLP